MTPEKDFLTNSFLAKGLRLEAAKKFEEYKELLAGEDSIVDQAKALMGAIGAQKHADAIEPSSYLTDTENEKYLSIKGSMYEIGQSKGGIEESQLSTYRELWNMKQDFEDLIVFRKNKTD